VLDEEHVLDEELMPAVDSPEPGGLDFGEFSAPLHQLLSSGAAVGLQVTVFDPELGEEERCPPASPIACPPQFSP
jgi:arginase